MKGGEREKPLNPLPAGDTGGPFPHRLPLRRWEGVRTLDLWRGAVVKVVRFKVSGPGDGAVWWRRRGFKGEWKKKYRSPCLTN